jgi:hypothetical protein
MTVPTLLVLSCLVCLLRGTIPTNWYFQPIRAWLFPPNWYFHASYVFYVGLFPLTGTSSPCVHDCSVPHLAPCWHSRKLYSVVSRYVCTTVHSSSLYYHYPWHSYAPSFLYVYDITLSAFNFPFPVLAQMLLLSLPLWLICHTMYLYIIRVSIYNSHIAH